MDTIEADLGGYPEDAHVVLHVTHTFVPEQCNATVGRGSTVGVYYTCSIADDSEAGQPGTLIANNSADPEPLYVLVGVGEIVRGWELGLIGLCEGEGVTLRVPPELAFGDHGDGGAIPPRATLTFSVAVAGVHEAEQPNPPMPDLFSRIDEDGDGYLEIASEVARHYARLGKPMPPRIWTEDDADRDGFIAPEEFSAPRGTRPPEWELLNALERVSGRWLQARLMGRKVSEAGVTGATVGSVQPAGERKVRTPVSSQGGG